MLIDFFVNVLAGNKDAVTARRRAAFAHAYARSEALKTGFDWYRALQADAKRNSRPRKINTPMVYLRGDADGRAPENYLLGLQKLGAKRVSGVVLPRSVEFAPLEVPQAFVQAVKFFATACHSD